MTTRWTIAVAFVALATGLWAQSIPLNGVITVRNSAYRTGKTIHVADASVRTANARPVTSDNEGHFALEVIGLEVGSSVNVDVDHDHWVVLDPEALEHVVLGSNEPLAIRMADPKELDAERIKYHGIAEAAIEARYKERMARLRDTTVALQKRLDEMREEFGGDSVDLADAITRLVGDRQAAIDGLDELVERMIVVDLDRASERFRRAFLAFSNSDLAEALILLDAQELDKDRIKADDLRARGATSVEDANRTIREVRMCFRLKADVLHASMRLRESCQVKAKELDIMEKESDAFEELELARVFVELAELETTLGNYTSSDGHLQLALSVPAMASEAGRGDRLVALCIAMNNHHFRGERDAMRLKGYEVMRMALAAEPPLWGTAADAHLGLAEVLLQNGELLDADAHLDTAAIFVAKDSAISPKVEVQIAALRGMVAFHDRRYDTAANFLEQGIALGEACSSPDLELISTLSYYLAAVNRSKGDLGTAMRLLLHCREQFNSMYGGEHPNLFAVESEMSAVVMQEATRTMQKSLMDSAAVLVEKSIAGFERWYGPRYDHLPFELNNLANIKFSLGEYGSAIELLRRSMDIAADGTASGRISCAFSLSTTAKVFMWMGRSDSALVYVDRALDTLHRVHGKALHTRMSHPLLQKGRILLELGRADTALLVLRDACELLEKEHGTDAPELFSAHVYLAQAFRMCGQLDSADLQLSWYDRHRVDLNAVEKSMLAIHKRQEAYVMEWRGDLMAAMSYADTSAMIYPDRTSAAVLGRMLLLNGQYSQAVSEFSGVLGNPRCPECSPDSYDIQSRSLLGGALLLSGRVDTARIVIEEAVRLNGDADALWYEYLLKKDERSANENVDALLRCWQVRRKDYNSSPAQKRTTWDELLARATETGRASELSGLGPGK